MKLYKEMLRKLAVVGLPLLAVTMVYTLVKGGSDCFGAYRIQQSTSAVSQVLALRYYVFSGVLFAFYGFSFLFSRPGSDVYHSLPVKRENLFLSVFLAAATWMGATILLNELEMLLILLISGCPFVPVYLLLSTLYYFVASMLVFAGAAVGCAVSGTFVTALASTGIVLLLPRYVQFLFARGIVEQVPIVGWLDLGALLDPSTNAATGILAMQLRTVYNGHLITLPHILYSLVPLIITLLAGLWLFVRRPSEFAAKSGGYRVWTVATSVLLAFAVLLPITMDHQKLFSVYGLVLMAAALGVFIVYQLIVSQRFKRTLATLPFYLIAVMAVLAVSGLIHTAADSMLNKTPAAGEIESVVFRGYDFKSGASSYATLLTGKIAFSDDETKEFVAQALADAVDELKTNSDNHYYDYKPFSAIEPIEIHLSGGGTIRRTISFDNIDELNALRMKNQEFASAVRAFPPMDSIQYMAVDNRFTQEEQEAILTSYMQEATENKLLSSYFYRSRTADMLPDGNYLTHGDNQVLTGISAAGHTGSRRYSDAYSLRLQTPETASLLMRTYNAYASETSVEELNAAIAKISDRNAEMNDNMSFYLSVFNTENSDGLLIQSSVNFYINKYMFDSESRYDTMQFEYLQKFSDALQNVVFTDDTDGLFVRMDWSYYDAENPEALDSYHRPSAYYRFKDEASEKEFLELMQSWEDAQRSL